MQSHLVRHRLVENYQCGLRSERRNFRAAEEVKNASSTEAKGLIASLENVMCASSIRLVAEVNSSGVCADKGFCAKLETYDQIYAYARERDWMEKPFHFVVSRWLNRRNAAPVCMGRRSGSTRAKRQHITENEP